MSARSSGRPSTTSSTAASRDPVACCHLSIVTLRDQSVECATCGAVGRLAIEDGTAISLRRSGRIGALDDHSRREARPLPRGPRRPRLRSVRSMARSRRERRSTSGSTTDHASGRAARDRVAENVAHRDAAVGRVNGISARSNAARATGSPAAVIAIAPPPEANTARTASSALSRAQSSGTSPLAAGVSDAEPTRRSRPPGHLASGHTQPRQRP